MNIPHPNAYPHDYDAIVFQDTRIFKAGNSLAIRIPSAIARRMNIQEGTAVEMGLDQGIIHVRKPQSRALADLIERITPENRHEPILPDLTDAERW